MTIQIKKTGQIATKRTEYKLTWSQYKKSEAKNVLDNMVVVKSGKPTFSVEMV